MPFTPPPLNSREPDKFVPPPLGSKGKSADVTSDPPASMMGKTADDYSRQVLNGMTFGFGDNLEAGVNALPKWLGGDKKPNENVWDAYNRNLKEIRGGMGKFQEENPKTAFALDTAGAVIPSIVTGGAASAGSIGTRLLPRVAKGAAVGAVYGGLGAAGNSNAETVPEALKAGAKGAAFGAAAGGAMPVVAQGLRNLGGGIAEAAVGIGKNDRKYGKTPGQAILDETSGLTPAAVEESARARMAQLSATLDAASQGRPVDIGAAQRQAQAMADEAKRGVNQPLAAELQELADALKAAPANFHGAQAAPGVIADTQMGPDAARIKRDFSNRFLRWNSNKSPTANSAGKQVYRTIDNAIDTAIPEAAETNQRISSLIPVAQRAEDKQLQAGAAQRVMHRIAAHTGAGIGAAAGYQLGGPTGAAMGLIIPELLASTPVEMAAARTLDAPSKSPAAVENLFRYLLSRGVQLMPPPQRQPQQVMPPPGQ